LCVRVGLRPSVQPLSVQPLVVRSTIGMVGQTRESLLPAGPYSDRISPRDRASLRVEAQVATAQKCQRTGVSAGAACSGAGLVPAGTWAGWDLGRMGHRLGGLDHRDGCMQRRVRAGLGRSAEGGERRSKQVFSFFFRIPADRWRSPRLRLLRGQTLNLNR
jgi:hypothetical protein